MKSFEEFLATVETSFPLNILKSKCCLSVSNSGRRGGEKAFSITVESLEQSLRDIKKNINSFPCDYDEATWRDNASKFLTDNHARTLCGTQTKPFYETINKVISWANEQTYADGELNLSAERIDNALIALEQNLALIPSSETQYCQSSNSVRPDQIIYYGVPGCGKSNKIDEMLKSVDEKNKIRVVFHPEYTNADFVGQILPNVDGGGVNYKFSPGPFSRILKRAYLHPDEQFYLVIEEINRGNCAQIFGDIFQLLDRDSKGFSEYSINADRDFAGWLKAADEGVKSVWEMYKENVGEGKLKLPPNLNILATMNTSDQSLFPIDSAFKRRFDWEYVPIDFSGKDAANYKIRINDADGLMYSWESFATKVNAKILDLTESEDKQLGEFFIKPDKDNFIISRDRFLGKVMFYLWNEVCKDEYKNGSFFREGENGEHFTFQDLYGKEGESKLKNFMDWITQENTPSE